MLKVDFYYDFLSPYSHLAARLVPAFAERRRVAVDWYPLRLPGLIKLAGNSSPASVPRKALYLLRDLERLARRFSLPFTMQRPAFFDTGPALVAAQTLNGQDRIDFSLAAFDALWAEGLKPTGDWVAEVVRRRGLPPAWARPDSSAAAEAGIEANTHAAFRAGAFGVPAFVLRGAGAPQLFWGVDRMGLLGETITEVRGEPPPAADNLIGL
jgi:2-hydroxychromene-2-carboxylate isomerase